MSASMALSNSTLLNMTSTVHLLLNVDGEQEQEQEEERTLTGIPVRLLWVPYCGLGVVLVVLMLASFLRYHCKHGHKYQQRRIELWKKFHMDGLIDHLHEVGGQSHACSSSPPPNGGLVLTPSTSSSAQQQQQQQRPQPDLQPIPPPPSRPKKSRKPLVFRSNNNGSMVDVRCANKTFEPCAQTPRPTHAGKRPPQHGVSVGTDTVGLHEATPPPVTVPLLPPGPSPSTQSLRSKASPVIWTLSRPASDRSSNIAAAAVKTPASFFSSPMDVQADEIEAEDDDVLLLQQTPL